VTRHESRYHSGQLLLKLSLLFLLESSSDSFSVMHHPAFITFGRDVKTPFPVCDVSSFFSFVL
jgi:hypothetical protein